MALIEARPTLRDTPEETAAPHPEEMKASFKVVIGRIVAIKATARTTPAGLIATALLTATILIPLLLLARSRARQPR